MNLILTCLLNKRFVARAVFLTVYIAYFGCGSKSKSNLPKEPKNQLVNRGFDVQYPSFEEKKELNILVFGDFGAGNTKNNDHPQWRVARAMTEVCDKVKCDFALGLGDNFYESGVKSVTDKQFIDRFEKPYKDLNIPFYMTLGNHDHAGNIDAQVAYTLRSNKWNMPHYHYPVPNLPSWIKAYAINSDVLRRGGQSYNSQLDDAKAHLCEGNSWKIIFGHQPPYSNSFHKDNEFILKKVVPLMDECNIQLHLGGDNHVLELFSDGNKRFVVSGSAGKLHDLSNPAERRAKSEFGASVHGFVILKINENLATEYFYDQYGHKIYEHSHTK